MKAPYRFIPISGWIHEPSWGRLASQDVPLREGLSGWLDLSIETRTPLMIGGARTPRQDRSSEVHFFQTPDGLPAIPGSGLRGPIRSVMEIATFGRAAFVDKVRHGVRDLSTGAPESLYKRRLTAGGATNGNPAYYLMKAGWLSRDADGNTSVLPCEWAKVHVTDLQTLSATGQGVWEPRQDVAGRYRAWGAVSLDQTLNVDVTDQVYSHSGGLWLRYRRAGTTATGPTASKAGTIVLTGKPMAGKVTDPKKKKFEFFFFDPVPVSQRKDVRSIWDDFLLIHDPQLGAAGRTGNASWPNYWRDRFQRGDRVPVFYIETPGGEIESMGLASMFRLAHKLNTHDLLAHANQRHTNEAVLDFPTLLLGAAADSPDEDVDQADATNGRKSRVVFETARLQGNPTWAQPITAVLASPKPQFYPAYVKQNAAGQYESYTPLNGSRPELAGRKRYPVKRLRTEPGSEAAQMATVMRPLARPTAFTGRVRYHNLLPQELGALVWCLRLWAPKWGTGPNLYHSIGMGKPLGMGAVVIRITGGCVEPNGLCDGQRVFHRDGAALAEADRCADLFVDHMEQNFQGEAVRRRPDNNATWSTSEQIESLLALAQPTAEDTAGAFTYMQLAEFRTAKDQRERLPASARHAVVAGAAGTSTDQTVFPRTAPASTTDPVNPPPKTPSRDSAAPFKPGDRVIDNNESTDSEIYWVTILRVLPGSAPKYEVRYDDGDTRILPGRSLRRLA